MNDVERFKIDREKETTVVENSRITKLYNFVSSFDKFKDFESFLLKDILLNAKLFRFQDQLLDKWFEKILQKKKKKGKLQTLWFVPDNYLVNILDSLQTRPSFIPAFDFNLHMTDTCHPLENF